MPAVRLRCPEASSVILLTGLDSSLVGIPGPGSALILAEAAYFDPAEIPGTQLIFRSAH